MSWPIVLVLIVIAGATLHYAMDLDFWGSVLPPLFIVAIYSVIGTIYPRSRRRR